MSKKKSKKQNRRKRSRAMPLAVADHKLQAGPKKSARGQNRKDHRQGGETPPAWFPVHMFFRQQAMVAAAFSNILRLQHQAAQMWLAPSQRR
jgi:hypothetical protein